MTVYIGADHGGFRYKEQLKAWLAGSGYRVLDCGNTTLDPADDFPVFAYAVTESVTGDPGSMGILICRSAGGMTIAANKVCGIRSVSAVTVDEVAHDRKHNDINVLALGADIFAFDRVQEMVRVFLTTPFMAEARCVRRLGMIAEYERTHASGEES